MTSYDERVDRFLKRAHRILDRMGIPQHDSVFYDAPALVDRLKTAKLYRDALRGKWLREKKKAVAANRALEVWRSGQTKSWKTRYEAVARDVGQAVDVFLKGHKPVTSLTHSGHPPIVSIVAYLVDRSNQLFANDSVVERNAIEETKAAKVAKARAESDLASAKRRLQWYEQRFGFFTDDSMNIFGPGTTMGDLAKDADSFPWKRGNPGYLGDYTLQELADEVDRRANKILDDTQVARGIAGVRYDDKKD